jgi:ATP-dependent Clp protease ATP-binding subunit ClpC
VSRIEEQLRNKDMGLELTENARRFLAKKGWDPVMGARPLRRTIQREIEDALSERILFNEIRPGQIIGVDCEGDPADVEHAKLVFAGSDKPSAAPVQDEVPQLVPADLGDLTDKAE